MEIRVGFKNSDKYSININNAIELYTNIYHYANIYLANMSPIIVMRKINNDKEEIIAELKQNTNNIATLFIYNKNIGSNNNPFISYELSDDFDKHRKKDEIIRILDRNYFKKSHKKKYLLIAIFSIFISALIGIGGYFIFK